MCSMTAETLCKSLCCGCTNECLPSHFPDRVPVGVITATNWLGQADMSNYRGITVGSVDAKLFAVIL